MVPGDPLVIHWEYGIHKEKATDEYALVGRRRKYRRCVVGKNWPIGTSLNFNWTSTPHHVLLWRGSAAF